MVHHRAGWLDPVFVWLTRIGSLGLVWIAIALVLAYLWRRPPVFLLTGAAVLLAELAARGVKLLVDEQRPAVRFALPKALVHVPRDSSFPSGHATTSFAAATILTFAKPRLAVPLYLLALAIGFSRVYVGVHYPLDVAGGAVLGFAIATALRQLEGGRRRSRRERPAG